MTESTSSTTQVKVTLPTQLQEFVQSKASKYGLSVSAYIKHLIIDDVKSMDLPIFPMSRHTEEVALAALQEHQQKKTHQITQIDTFLKTL